MGPCKVIKKIGKLAYRLDLSESMAGVHPVFHVSQLRKCLEVIKNKEALLELLEDNLNRS